VLHFVDDTVSIGVIPSLDKPLAKLLMHKRSVR